MSTFGTSASSTFIGANVVKETDHGQCLAAEYLASRRCVDGRVDDIRSSVRMTSRRSSRRFVRDDLTRVDGVDVQVDGQVDAMFVT